MKKRILALIIAAFLVLGCCGCKDTTVTNETESWGEGGGTTVEKDGQTTAEKDENNTSDGNNGEGDSSGGNTTITEPMKVDLKGATITIYDASSQFSTDTSNKTKKSYADILASVQKSLNCKFSVKVVDDNKLKT